MKILYILVLFFFGACNNKDNKNEYYSTLCEMMIDEHSDSLTTISGFITIDTEQNILFGFEEDTARPFQKTILVPCGEKIRKWVFEVYNGDLNLRRSKFEPLNSFSATGKYIIKHPTNSVLRDTFLFFSCAAGNLNDK